MLVHIPSDSRHLTSHAVIDASDRSASAPQRSSELHIDMEIASVDQRLGDQLDAILHHPDFQRLEAAWRGLKFLVDQTDFRKNVHIEVLDVDKETLRRDFEDAPDVVQSGLFRHTYTEEYDTPGASRSLL